MVNGTKHQAWWIDIGYKSFKTQHTISLVCLHSCVSMCVCVSVYVAFVCECNIAVTTKQKHQTSQVRCFGTRHPRKRCSLETHITLSEFPDPLAAREPTLYVEVEYLSPTGVVRKHLHTVDTLWQPHYSCITTHHLYTLDILYSIQHNYYYT